MRLSYDSHEGSDLISFQRTVDSHFAGDVLLCVVPGGERYRLHGLDCHASGPQRDGFAIAQICELVILANYI